MLSALDFSDRLSFWMNEYDKVSQVERFVGWYKRSGVINRLHRMGVISEGEKKAIIKKWIKDNESDLSEVPFNEMAVIPENILDRIYDLIEKGEEPTQFPRTRKKLGI